MNNQEKAHIANEVAQKAMGFYNQIKEERESAKYDAESELAKELAGLADEIESTET